MFPEVNWSQVIRTALEERAVKELAARRSRDRKRILRAMRIQDVAAKKTAKYKSQWSGVEVIRWWRERRYSSSMPR